MKKKQVLLYYFTDRGKWSKAMKLKTILILLLIVKFSVLAYSQNPKLSLQLENVTLKKVFKEIKTLTGYTFVYSDELMSKAKNVSINVKDMPLEDVLKKCLEETNLDFYIEDGVVIVKPRETNSKPVLVKIKGKVTDDFGDPMPGATVVIKGTTKGTTTDTDGNYSIETSSGSVLIFSYIGMKKQEVAVGNNKEINVRMEQKASDLNEVTVIATGYQTIEKRKLTSAITSIKMDDIKTAGITSVDKMLESHVPGMIFMQNSGQVGAAPKLRIRGTSTILGNRQPLWVLDGIVLSDPVNVDPQQLNDLDAVNLLGNAISGLNPEDIDQIDVLKDASATALYGPKAANGVIVITTKKGTSGKPTINYSSTVSFMRRPHYSDKSVYMMNSQERMDVSREMVARGVQYSNVTQWAGYEEALQNYYAGNIGYAKFKELTDYYASVNTDWFGLLTRNSVSHNHTISLSGGADNIKYYSSLGYSDQNGVIRGENNKRYSAMVNVTANYKKFSAQFSFNGNVTSRSYTPSDLGLMNYAYNMSRTIPAYTTEGDLFYYPEANPSKSLYYDYNILQEKANSGDKTKGNQVNFRANLKYKLLPSFDLEGTFAYGVSNTTNEIYYTKDTYHVFKLRQDQEERNDLCPVGGELQRSNTRNTNYTARLQSNYSTLVGKSKKHLVMASAGLEVNSTQYNSFRITRRGYFPEMGGYFDVVPTTYAAYYQQWMSTKAALGSYNRQLNNELAWYGLAGYSFDNRYFLNVSIRGDQSNAFGSRTNNRFLPIWAVSGRWNIKNDIAKNVSWINDLALIASWGWQGNMLPGVSSPYLVMRQVTGTNLFYDSPYGNIVNYPNPDLKWEKTSSFNTSVEFSLFNSKVSGSIGYFYKRTRDAFLNKTVSEINGIQEYIINSGTIENQGVEINLQITPINNVSADGSRKGFVWRIDPQLGQVLNKILNKSVNNRNNVLVNEITYADFLNGTANLAGKSINTFYSYRFKELSHEDGSPIFYGTEAELASEYQTQYSQMSKEDVFLAVMTESGRREPFIQGGITNYFGWGNFGLSFNIAYSLGNKIRLMKIASGYATTYAYPQQNLRKEFVYRWRKPGDEAYTNIPGLNVNNINSPWWTVYPATSYSFGGSPYEMYDNSDIRVISGDYLKLQSVSFRYTLDDKLAKSFGLRSAYVSITGTDLFTIADKRLKGQDPTQSGSTPNINLSVRPSVSFSINVSF